MIRTLLLVLLCVFAFAAEAAKGYRADYRVRFLPDTGQAEVSLTLTPEQGRVSKLRMRMPEPAYLGISGDGKVARKGDEVIWQPLRKHASTLTWRHRIDNRRRDGGYDARITREWVLMRADDLFPAARVTASKGAVSSTRVRFDLPSGWSNVDMAYPSSLENRFEFVIRNPERSFARPVGWVIAGQVGTRRDFLQGIEVSVAGPRGSEVRRNDILGFLNSLMPEYRQLIGELPPKLLIVSADDPMWRGGLSGPGSLYMHSARPMISENGSSTLAHELFHVFTRIRGADNDDWIAEGLAEYYAIELTHRAGLLSDARHAKAFDWMRRYGKEVRSLSSDRSSSRRTYRAVTLLRELDAELRKQSRGRHSLDDVVRELLPIRRVSREDLQSEVERLIGASKVLDTPLLR